MRMPNLLQMHYIYGIVLRGTSSAGAESKTLQEVITLAVFFAFAALCLREPIRRYEDGRNAPGVR